MRSEKRFLTWNLHERDGDVGQAQVSKKKTERLLNIIMHVTKAPSQTELFQG